MRTFEAFQRGLASAEDDAELVSTLRRIVGAFSTCTYFLRYSQNSVSSIPHGDSESSDLLSPQRKLLRVRRMKSTSLPVDEQLLDALSHTHLSHSKIIT